jgi:NAD(P)-dependent dehydrogenase (short-subunit alcohol dehydrogenase family)
VAKLAGKVAVVSGGGGGIGGCITRLFVREGAAVVIADLQQDQGEEIASSIVREGGQAVYQYTDVTRSAQVEAVMQRALQEYKCLDIVVNCAGWLRVEMAIRLDEADFDRTLATHVKGTWLMCKYAIPHMMQAGTGAIVNISSMQAYGAIPGRVAYEAAKGGISAMTRELALEYGPAGIRVNAVCPGVIMTERNLGRHAGLTEEERRLRVESYPLRRLGTPEDVANAVLFLASEDAAWITGTDLIVDGGMSIQLAEAVLYPPFRRLWRETVPSA